jgi:hypothetical protein
LVDPGSEITKIKAGKLELGDYNLSTTFTANNKKMDGLRKHKKKVKCIFNKRQSGITISSSPHIT